MAKGKITGSIMGDDGTVYRAGDEDAFGAYLDAMPAERRKSSLAHLAKHGQIDGFGAKKAELTEADPTLAAHDEDGDEEHVVDDSASAGGDEDEGAPRGRARGRGKR